MADAVIAQTNITLDMLLEMGSLPPFEIIDGVIVEMTAAGVEHHILAGNIHRVLDAYVNTAVNGVVFFDGLTYLMNSDLKRLKHSYVPDVSFIRLENILKDFELAKPYPGAPDLAVEVVSPSEGADDIQTKLRTYLAKGTEQVWIVYPSTQEVYQYRRERESEVTIYRGSKRLDVETMFPGLELTTDIIFKLPAWAARETEA